MFDDLLKLEMRIKNCVSQDSLHGQGQVILAKPSELLNVWDDFITQYRPLPSDARHFWENVMSLSVLDDYDAGRCIYALMHAVESASAHGAQDDCTANEVFRLAETLAASAAQNPRHSYSQVQRAAGRGVLEMFSEPRAYIETIINAVKPSRQR
jgi:hypothetical protein